MKPSDCVLAFAIPTCEDDFLDAKHDSHRRDFVRKSSLSKYYKEVISHFEEIMPYLEKLGVIVVQRLKLSDLKSLLKSNSNKVVILFSHWRDDDGTVEFFDGMATSDSVVNEVPTDFEGIIDLCICHPTNLAIKLHNHLPPSSLVKFTDKKNTPYKWLYFYWAVFTVLDDSDVSYVEALKQSVKAFAEMK